jgi:hypothetical protein
MWEFMGNHPIAATVMCFIVCVTIAAIVEEVVKVFRSK